MKGVGMAMAFLMLLTIGPAEPAAAELLKGRVFTDAELMRIHRPAQAPDRAPLSGQATNPNRIARPTMALNGQADRGLVDPSMFVPPLTASASRNDFNLGVVKADDFKSPPPKNFDLGAERGSREMVLAWERWHKQLSEAIYTRWSSRAQNPGQATVRVTVTSDRRITASIMRSTGGSHFDVDLMDSIVGLNGNSGLTFPARSQRQKVAFEADYIAARNVSPGYSWVKNDYERVQQGY